MIIYLKPKSLFPTLHSDTIFGAILYAASQIYTEQFHALLERFKDPNQKIPFLLSSSFPFLEENGDKIRFYPKPIMEPVEHSINQAKTIKKINYVQENIFKSWINPDGEKHVVDHLEDYSFQEGLLLENDLETDFNYQSSFIPHNSINRITNASENIFYSSGVSFSGMGLFFLIRFIDEEYKNLVESSIKFLRDRGFGGDISVGKGHFDYEIAHEEPFRNEKNRFVTLSRYSPTSSELKAFNGELWFEIGSKRGRSANGEQRKQFKFFREGSSFSQLEQTIYGRVVEVAPNALKYGLAYTVG